MLEKFFQSFKILRILRLTSLVVDTGTVLLLVYPYVILWAMNEWGWLDYNFLTKHPAELIGSYLVNDDMPYYITQLYGSIKDGDQLQLCSPSSDSDIECFDSLMFPIIWLLNTHYSLISIFSAPIIFLLYMIDSSLFIDDKATMNDLLGNDIPKEGFPMLIGQIHSQHRLSFGDHQFITKPNYYHLNF